MEPAKKVRKLENRNQQMVQKVWFKSDHQFQAFTKVQIGAMQRISVNPIYLHLRPEDELLSVLLDLVTKGDDEAKQWWYQSNYRENRFRFQFREQLAEMIQKLLNSQTNVNVYLAAMTRVGKVSKKKRESFRAQLFLVKDRAFDDN